MKSFSNVFKQLVARALEAHKLRKRCENKDWKSKQTMTASKKLSYSQTDLWSEQTDIAVLQTLSRISIIYMCAGFCESGPLSVCVCVWFYFTPTRTHSSLISSKDNKMCICQKHSAQQCERYVILMSTVSKPNRCKLLRKHKIVQFAVSSALLSPFIWW